MVPIHSGLSDDDKVEVMSRFAELASLALDNARLFAQSQDQTYRLTLLNEMGRQMSLAGSRDGIFEVAPRLHPGYRPRRPRQRDPARRNGEQPGGACAEVRDGNHARRHAVAAGRHPCRARLCASGV